LAAQPAPTLPICLYHLESNDAFKLLMLQNLFCCVYRKLDSAILGDEVRREQAVM
jgi:hypothetical protein